MVLRINLLTLLNGLLVGIIIIFIIIQSVYLLICYLEGRRLFADEAFNVLKVG